MKELNAKQGRKRFVTKETNGNGNGNNRKGHIVSFVPSNSFTGNMDDLTTSNFRALKFDGVLIFEELSGCFGSAYLIEKGVVKKKLILTNIAALAVRDCSAVIIATDWYQYSPSNGETRNDAHYIGTTYSYGFECSATNYQNYDQDQAQGDYNGGGGDSYYNNYLILPTIKLEDLIIQLQNPCNSSVMNQIRNASTLTDINGFLNIFQTDRNTHFSIKDAYIPNDYISDGTTFFNVNTNTYEITLNRNVMDNASKEYIAVTIMHEIIHGYLAAYLGVPRDNVNQHNRMTEDLCVDFLANYLIKLFPNLDVEAAKALAWYGFDATPRWNEFTLAEKYAMQQINEKYKNHELGTPCQ